MAPLLRLRYGDAPQESISASEVGQVENLQDIKLTIRKVLKLPPGEFDLFDIHGHIENDVDLMRTFHKFNKGEEDCEIEVRNSWEQNQFARIGLVEDKTQSLEERLARVEATMESPEADGFVGVLFKLQDLQLQIGALAARVVVSETFVPKTYQPMVDDLCHARDQMARDLRIVQEKFGTFDIEEIREIITSNREHSEQIAASVIRVNQIDAELQQNKAKDFEDAEKNKQMVNDLQRHLEGKIEVAIQGEMNLAREVEGTSLHLKVLADDIRLLKDDMYNNLKRCTEFMEENGELRTIMGQVREDTEHLRADSGMLGARLHVVEGEASEKWDGFLPGVLYFRRWHGTAKGADVKLSGNLMSATARGFTAAFGVVMTSDEGLAIGDGPCRRFGTPGSWSSYYEIEAEIVQAAPPNCGGLYVGFSIQNGEEILAHPKREFDGWLVGGAGKALTCRAGYGDAPPVDPDKLPATYVPSPSCLSAGIGAETGPRALQLLRAALPPVHKGQVREAECMWNSQGVKMGDRIGVLFKCHRGGGAKMMVTVNQEIIMAHEFVDAPAAEAIGFLTPIIRLAGSGKSAKLLPGLSPPSRLLAD